MEEAQHEEDVVAMISELALVVAVPNDNIWILGTRNPKLLNQLCHGNESVIVQSASGHSNPVNGSRCVNMELGEGKRHSI